MDVLGKVDSRIGRDDFFLSIVYKRLPEDVRDLLFRPYLSEDGGQLRFSVRVFESDPTLRRGALLARIDRHLTETLGYQTPTHLRALYGDQPIQRMLDLGCGTGLSGQAFADIATHITGVDLSPNMLARARSPWPWPRNSPTTACPRSATVLVAVTTRQCCTHVVKSGSFARPTRTYARTTKISCDH